MLVFVDWFYPGYLAGGPVQSIISLVEHLKDEVDFWVVSSDRDLNSKEPYDSVIRNVWSDSPLGCKVYYASPDKFGKKKITELIRERPFTMVYINSLFSKKYSILPLLILKQKFRHMPIVLAPRGMFSRGALSLKAYKKKGFLFYAKHSGLHKHVIWHAASVQERVEIEKAIGGQPIIRTVPNLPRQIACQHKPTKVKGELRLFYSSRISEVKNTLFALEALHLVHSVNVRFHIFGLIENEAYWKKCTEVIANMPKNITVEYKGTYSQLDAGKVFENEEVLLLPTLNENFGHSIVESLTCGCPVIISDQTPWRNLKQYGAGYDLPLHDKLQFAKAIENYAAMTEAEFDVCRKGAIHYIEQKTDRETTLSLYKELFHA